MLPLIFGKSWKCQIWTHTCSWYLQIDILEMLSCSSTERSFLCLLWKTKMLSDIYRPLLIWWRKRWRRASPRKRYFLIVHEPLVYIEIVQFQEKDCSHFLNQRNDLRSTNTEKRSIASMRTEMVQLMLRSWESWYECWGELESIFK